MYATPARPVEAQVHGIVFVVDGADSARLKEAHKELQLLAMSPAAIGKPLLM
jgi:hypothetical protein